MVGIISICQNKSKNNMCNELLAHLHCNVHLHFEHFRLRLLDGSDSIPLYNPFGQISQFFFTIPIWRHWQKFQQIFTNTRTDMGNGFNCSEVYFQMSFLICSVSSSGRLNGAIYYIAPFNKVLYSMLQILMPITKTNKRF